MKLKPLSFLFLFPFITSCSIKNSLKNLLVENPEILIEALEKNPEKFADVMNKLNMRSRQAQERMNQQQELAQREAEFKNPREIRIEPSRAISGNPKALITIVAFSDFQCPYCKRGFETVNQVKRKYGQDVRFVFKHFPLPFHSMAKPAAEYFEAIALQSSEKAFRFHDEVFMNQNLLEPEKEKFLNKMAKKVGADMARLKTDLASSAVKNRIQEDMNEGERLGVRGTPKFFINGVSLNGARPMNDFESVIDRWLKLAEERKLSSK